MHRNSPLGFLRRKRSLRINTRPSNFATDALRISWSGRKTQQGDQEQTCGCGRRMLQFGGSPLRGKCTYVLAGIQEGGDVMHFEKSGRYGYVSEGRV
eukprot:1392293-Ditylum_brightwellii.AAC.1